MVTVQDLVSYTVTRDGPIMRISVRYGGSEGHGAVAYRGTVACLGTAMTRAMRDLNRRLSGIDAETYRAEWAALADRAPHEVYVPEGIRPPD